MNTIHVTNHSKANKMEGIQSIGTTSLVNPICQKRKQECGGVCAHCYAAALCKMRHSLNDHLIENFNVLTTHLLTKQEAQAVPVTTVIARIESFGDVANVTQARNYIRIIRAHSYIKFGIWSKNWMIWLAAFRKEGKPRNCTFVLSSMSINQPTEVPEIFRRYCDHVFTVWDRKTYPTVCDKKTECAGLSCMACQKCYKKNTSFYINERLR